MIQLNFFIYFLFAFNSELLLSHIIPIFNHITTHLLHYHTVSIKFTINKRALVKSPQVVEMLH